ncbi:hypothetical protein ACO1PK_00935 [Alishewanella sp. d11]|uniref:hypothetical protein n=1 Tax=Alishewanella sp. d11 TaxID=3414030 RepID=UPI003BF775F4
MSKPTGKLVYGIGINDSDYKVSTYNRIDGKLKKTWSCPYYDRWLNMLRRCYSEKYLSTRQNYLSCSVCKEWLVFSNFKAWMETQDWQGKDLDKDYLSASKEYSPENCVFISPLINTFIIDSGSSRGKSPIGVSFSKSHGKFHARCNNPFTGKTENLGYYSDASLASEAWRSRKHQMACMLAETQSDERVSNVLKQKYANQLRQADKGE